MNLDLKDLVSIASLGSTGLAALGYWVNNRVDSLVTAKLSTLKTEIAKQFEDTENNINSQRAALGKMAEKLEQISVRQTALAHGIDASKRDIKETVLSSHEALQETIRMVVASELKSYGSVKWEK